jgi:hypothetical protein
LIVRVFVLPIVNVFAVLSIAVAFPLYATGRGAFAAGEAAVVAAGLSAGAGDGDFFEAAVSVPQKAASTRLVTSADLYFI